MSRTTHSPLWRRLSSCLPSTLALLLALGCAPPAAAPSTAPSTNASVPAPRSAPQPITMILDWIERNPQHLPFIIAKGRGWYDEQGLDVTLQGGRGSVQVAQLMTAGQGDFG